MSRPFSLIICTYMRHKALLTLLNSVKGQTLYPDEIIVVDGSANNETQRSLELNSFKNLSYFKVGSKNKGLTKQRNFGINKLSKHTEIVCFLDDDTELERDYFEILIDTYNKKPEAIAVGGYIINEVKWKPVQESSCSKTFCFDGWERDEPLRFRLRKPLGLLPDVPPGFLPSFSHGRAVGFLPPSGKIYEVEQIMGCALSCKKKVFDNLRFSTYFEGYGLYEDADFCLRLAKIGKLYINTAARLNHYHDHSGRPNKFKYGKMVVRNGWYVWRVKYPCPSFKARFKWHATAFLLTLIRFSNIATTSKKQEALTEGLGRVVGWLSLLINKPKVSA